MVLTAETTKAAKSMELKWDPKILPPFPAIALKALKLMSGTDSSLLDLCNLIRSDPAFSVALLKMANSPLVAFSKNVTSVLQASMLLGFQRLKSVILAVGLKAYLKDSPSPLMSSCWRHSVACAILAERSAKLSFLDNDFAYTAGILHDIGRVALATLMPESYARVVARGADQPQDLLQVEQEFCGIDHCQAGSSLATAWNLPDAIIDVTACHHDPQAHPKGAASLIAPSCALADAVGFTVVQYRSPRTYAEILAEFSEPVRRRFPDNAHALASELANEIRELDSL